MSPPRTRRTRRTRRTGDGKLAALRLHHALNPRAQAVSDPAFTAGNPFFDARDLVQVKYEMLRRARQEEQPVSRAAAAFGFSRPSFYMAQAVFEAAGLPGLLPQRPGPRRAHKLSEAVVDFLEQQLTEDATLRVAQLVRRLHERFSLEVHPRSVERALERRRNRGAQSLATPASPASPVRTDRSSRAGS
ncbi:MAG: helix-turn-helix domain containing protein [Chloroflexota bacterium]